MLNRLKPIEIGKKIKLHIIKTDKFKTTLVSVYLKRPLIKEEVTKNALLSMVLPRGTKKYTSSMEISKKLEGLYGAFLGCDVAKKGERNIIQFRMQLINDQYVEDNNLLAEGMEILNEYINDPHMVNGCFEKDYVDQEKDNLIERIEGRKNDKMKYAYDRCIEEMCKDENFSLYTYGNIEDLKNVTSESLYEHYKNIIRTSPIDICVVGDFDELEIQTLVTEKLKFKQVDVVSIEREKIECFPDQVNKIEEEMDINQGKLNLGYRTNIPFESELYHPLLVYSNILGGGPNSKFFKNIREKESLCYYIFSRVEKFKSLMMIGSGIEFVNYEKGIKLIEKEIGEMNQGNFSNEDIESAKNSIITSIRGMTDSPYMLGDFYYSQAISGSEDTLETMIEKIRKVTKEQIIEAGKNMQLDTIYFLKNKGEVR
ncbi:EF-P 5-aminopentanol modification-associated protein YfmF [Crassaminicella profunda]|uniref:EF-P 5-aminopentanol modification-associated protein YfmF n=1 Tax=Crassaminicella profunda TaxID=1286698 RepID=UPI001CA754D0|nr:pitrilysin family protein [Crassaminicella profunda]QZY57195.1 insulinase family protein [Crassaminicella profunda]